MTENHPSAAEADLILGDYGTDEAVPLQRNLFFGKLWKPCLQDASFIRGTQAAGSPGRL
jgi:hypothetical protein